MRFQLLIDAIYLNIGGGLELLKYFLHNISGSKLRIYLLLDKRVINEDLYIDPSMKIKYVSNSFYQRHIFYLKNKNSFEKVFCLANIPPTVKINAKVFTYFHQYYYLFLPEHLSNFMKFEWKFKSMIFRVFLPNSDKILVQTDHMKNELIKKYNIDKNILKCVPFYDLSNFVSKNIKKIKNKFLYVSHAFPHKNHFNLIEAFDDAYQTLRKGELHLTIDKNNENLILFLNEIKSKGTPIFNHGIISKADIKKLYEDSEFLIFPSLMESFGLPILEAINLECKILVSNLPYAKSVCSPSLTFDPTSISDMSDAIKKAITSEPSISTSNTSNRIKELVDMLSS